MRVASIPRILAAVAAATVLGGATLPPALHGPGQWEVGAQASGAGGTRHCLADPALLTQWEHRRAQCTRVILSSTADRATVQYTCTGGGFGTSAVHVITPRSVRIHTQGISGGLPFNYVIHARRTGACPSR